MGGGRWGGGAGAAATLLPEGRVVDVVGMLVEVGGFVAAVGSQLEIPLEGRTLALEGLGFRDGRLLAAPLGSTAGVEPGARGFPSPRGAYAHVGDDLLGSVIDAFGDPADGKPAPPAHGHAPLRAPHPPP